ncbi:hypothetical protein LWC35_28045 [Pseudonocardia kujensis]|uniref:hypothetical protein n=1 Tax=Pseudonocardia kujensis TaxID=1128675 RepID=UPI001E427246|nr:hypothetical protein [Pseudonocardia kujensis]MCE0766729.1 hypothetical protein [Pseudonocardia kujensis]
MATPEPVRNPVDEALDLLGTTLAGAEANDREDLARRLRAARDDLAGATTAGRRVAAMRTAAQELTRALDSLRSDLRYRRAALADPARGARLRAELSALRKRSSRLRAVSREWSQILGDGFAGLSSDVEFTLRTRTRAVLVDTEHDINGHDPGKERAALVQRFRDRLAAEADRLRVELDYGVRVVADRLTEGTELTERLPMPRIPVPPGAETVALIDEPPTGDAGRTPVPARLLTVVMPSYGGVMMAFVLTRFLGLAVPVWMLVTAACLGAVGLGGAALSGERKRGLDRRRGELRTAVRTMADEFQLTVGKQARDAARSANGELRRAVTAALTRRDDELDARLGAALSAVEGLEKLAADLTDIDDDIATIDGLRRRADTLMPRFPG